MYVTLLKRYIGWIIGFLLFLLFFFVFVMPFIIEIDGENILAFLFRNRRFSTSLFTSRTTPPGHYAWAHARGRGSRWKFPGLHTLHAKRWRSALFHRGIKAIFVHGLTFTISPTVDQSETTCPCWQLNQSCIWRGPSNSSRIDRWWRAKISYMILLSARISHPLKVLFFNSQPLKSEILYISDHQGVRLFAFLTRIKSEKDREGLHH